jgi:hypothetical protein
MHYENRFPGTFRGHSKRPNVTIFFLSDQGPIKITFAWTFAKFSRTLSDVQQ